MRALFETEERPRFIGLQNAWEWGIVLKQIVENGRDFP